MIIREMIIEELRNRGYNAEAQNNIKNGVVFEGIRIMNDSNVAPVIYVDEIIKRAEDENKSFDEVVSAVISIYESHNTIDFNIDELFDRDFVLSHLYIGLQRESTEELVKRPCAELDGIESYLYIRRDKDDRESYSVKLNMGLLVKTNITVEEAWKSAEQNTNAETTIQSMAYVMAELMGMEYSEELEQMAPYPLYVLTNESKTKGASAVLNKEVLAQFGRKYNTEKIVVLPSSIHEMLLIPYTEEMSLDEFSAMVTEVNGNEVAPEERLTDRAYIVTL